MSIFLFCWSQSRHWDIVPPLYGSQHFPTKEALWPCQTDIAEAYGLPGTTEGLQRIQNEVQRAITEGAHVLG